jgi:hypothetical protein
MQAQTEQVGVDLYVGGAQFESQLGFFMNFFSLSGQMPGQSLEIGTTSFQILTYTPSMISFSSHSMLVRNFCNWKTQNVKQAN